MPNCNSSLFVEKKPAEMRDSGFFGARYARKLAKLLTMTDKEFDEYPALEGETRTSLKSKPVETEQAAQHIPRPVR
jgi:hypothetical protein